MAHPSPNAKPHFPFQELNSPVSRKPISQRQGNSCTSFLFKSLFFIFLLIALSLFPSQAPDFVNQTILVKFWEFIHVLVIGIAVCYGIFSCRNVEKAQMGLENSLIDSDSDSSHSYLSRIFQFSSVFEEGFADLCGSDGKRVNRSFLNSQKNFSLSKNGGEIPSGYDDNDEIRVNNQAWNSQYIRGESLIRVAQPNQAFEQWHEPGLVSNHKPLLELPIRSLRSNLREDPEDDSDSVNERESSTSSSKSSDKSERRGFGDLGPINLEDKFYKAASSSSSSILKNSRPGKLGVREKSGSLRLPSQFRPPLIDEAQPQSLKSQSCRSSVSSHASSVSSSSSEKHSLSYSICNSDISDLEMEENKKSNYGGLSPLAHMSQLTQMTHQASMTRLHSRGQSRGYLSEKDIMGCSEDHVKEASKRENADPMGSKRSGLDSLKLARNPKGLVKSPSIGKSVRTIRANNRINSEAVKVEGTCMNRTDNNVDKKLDESEAVYMRKDETIITSLPNSPKPTSSNYYDDKERKDFSQGVEASPADDLEGVAENFPVFSDEEVKSNVEGDVESDAYMVDKKADEFIAKFREQIKLQKLESIRKSRGLSNGGSYFR